MLKIVLSQKIVAEYEDFKVIICRVYLNSLFFQSILRESLYALMVEEAFKFLPRSQLMFTAYEDYSRNEVRAVHQAYSPLHLYEGQILVHF